MFKRPLKIPEQLIFDIKSLEEEKANQISHLIGVIFWLIFAPILIYQSLFLNHAYQKIGIWVYAFSFLSLLAASTLYHSAYVTKARNRFRLFDHISIYAFIAGSYTPILLFYIYDDMGKSVLIILWIITLIGTVFKLFFLGKFKVISTAIYLLMGWAALFILNKILLTMPLFIFFWIVSGGIAYTFGTYFYLHKKLKYTHLYWHIMVLIGAICHFIAIFYSVLHFQN